MDLIEDNTIYYQPHLEKYIMNTSKILNDKHQTTDKFQNQITKFQKHLTLLCFGHRNFINWKLFEICFLMLEVFRGTKY